MIPFNDYMMINSVASQWLSIPLTEASIDDKIVYEKDSQFISISSHGEDRLARKWWTDFNDPDFTKFADKSLSSLRSWYKSATNKEGMLQYRDLIFKKMSEVAFVVRDPDKKDTDMFRYNKGIIGSLRQSKDKALDSYHIMTILNIDFMDKTRPLLSKVTPTIELFDYRTKGQNAILKKELETKISSLTDKSEELQLEIWENEDTNRDTKQTKALKNKLQQIELELKNLTNKLTKIEESVIIKDTKSGRTLILIEV